MIAIKSNIGDVIAKQVAFLETLKKGGTGNQYALREAVTTILPVMKTRIHEEGKAADDTKIGRYSTHPIYVNPKNSPKSFAVEGKHGATKFKSGIKKGEPHKTRYFEGGYSEFKTHIGRNTLGSVNLSLTGGLSNQTIVVASEDGYGIGFSNAELKERAEALQKKYQKKIWALSNEESKLFTKVAEQSIKELYDRS